MVYKAIYKRTKKLDGSKIPKKMKRGSYLVISEREKVSLGNATKTFRREKGWSQKTLAEKIRVSDKTVRRVEAGLGCSERTMQMLLLQFMNKSEYTVVYDYFKVRIPTLTFDKVIQDILKMDPKEFIYTTGKYHIGYDMTHEYVDGGILIHFSSEYSDAGVLIELQGRGCRYYEQVLMENGEEWVDYVNRCIGARGNATRIDLAINDYRKLFDLGELARKYQNGELRTSFNSVQVRNVTDDNLHSSGISIQFGSYKSPFYWLFYEKDLELLAKKKIKHREESQIKNRYEVRMKGKHADKIFREELQVGKSISSIAFRLLRTITFLDKKKGKPKEKWGIHKPWEEFLGDAEKYNFGVYKKAEIEPPPESLAKISLDHFARMNGSTYSALRKTDSDYGTTLLQDIQNKEMKRRSDSYQRKLHQFGRYAEQLGYTHRSKRKSLILSEMEESENNVQVLENKKEH